MKILFGVDEYFPIQSAPGVRIESFRQKLADLSPVVFGGGIGICKDPGIVLIQRPVRTTPLQLLLYLARFQLAFLRLARKAKPQIVVLSVPKYELLLCAPFLRRFTTSLVVDLRDSLAFIEYEAFLESFMPRFIAKPLGALARWLSTGYQLRALRSATLITVANAGILETLPEWAKLKTVVVSNGVNTSHFIPKMNRGREQRLQIAYLGNFVEKDRFNLFAELPKETKELFELNLIGSGRNKPRVLDDLRRSGIQYNDRGVVDHKLLPELLDSMELGFLFRSESAQESIPVAFYEFASMNIPVICNPVGVMEEFVRANDLGYVVKESSELDALLRKLSQDRLSLRSFDQLHNKAVERFSRESQAKRFREVITPLLISD